MTTKITDANIDSNNLDNTNFNIGLLGFKMAVNEGLTIFNLVDGVVDEFNDESGTDEAEGTNDLYNATDDYYINSSTQDASPLSISAGFSISSITEPDTSVAGTNPAYGSGTVGTFTVPTGLTATTIFAWGAGGGSAGTVAPSRDGGGGGFATGTLAVTGGQVFNVAVGEGGFSTDVVVETDGNVGSFMGGGRNANPDDDTPGAGPATVYGGCGGGLTALLSNVPGGNSPPSYSAPQVFFVAGSGGSASHDTDGGGGGGTTGFAAVLTPSTSSAQTNATIAGGGGGSQSVGGQASNGGSSLAGNGDSGSFLKGGNAFSPGPYGPQANGGGGAGYYGGGSGIRGPSNTDQGGGGGSSYIGHPQITCGSTTAASDTGGNHFEGGGVSNPNYVASTNEGGCQAGVPGDNGYVLITGSVCATATSTTIVSASFTSTTVPTTSRIVVFEENVDSPTLNTDIIASVSRDGTNFTNVTLADSGYVTGSSGQRILTGQVDISGQPSGQSMRWKLALANNQVKIHGVSLQWS